MDLEEKMALLRKTNLDPTLRVELLADKMEWYAEEYLPEEGDLFWLTLIEDSYE